MLPCAAAGAIVAVALWPATSDPIRSRHPQNWQHVETVVEALNRLPRDQHGTDIMRVREWALAGHARHYRQTVLLGSFLSPAMSRLMGAAGCANHAGAVRCVPEAKGLLGAVVPQVRANDCGSYLEPLLASYLASPLAVTVQEGMGALPWKRMHPCHPVTSRLSSYCSNIYNHGMSRAARMTEIWRRQQH